MTFFTSNSLPTIGYIVKIFPKLSETFILQEILELERLGLNLVILSLRPPTDADTHSHFHQLKASVVYAPVLADDKGDDNIAQQSLWTSWVTEKIREYDITHLHAHYVTEPTNIAMQVQARIGIPYSFTTHAKDLFLSSKEDVSRKVDRAQFVLTCTEYNKEYLEQMVQSDTPTYRVYHGVNLDVFKPSTPEISHEDKTRPLILSIGRFRPKKGFTILIQACASLKKAGHHFQCVLVGYGPLEQDLKQMIHQLGVSNCVRLTGKVPQDGILDWFRQASVFVLPCQIAEDGDRDGVPNVLVEAMAMGLPVVSTAIASIPELIHDDHNGILTPQHDPESLAEALGLLLQDSDRRRTLGIAARKTVEENFCVSRNIRVIYDIFKSIASPVQHTSIEPLLQQVPLR
ncbi:MAG: glycosyltransferase family 4 protein [Nitrospirota bacterium]|nr:glycosyltransferase family 4 protein [Nitrospirota bacterium]